jgi:hypothetical protein
MGLQLKLNQVRYTWSRMMPVMRWAAPRCPETSTGRKALLPALSKGVAAVTIESLVLPIRKAAPLFTRYAHSVSQRAMSSGTPSVAASSATIEGFRYRRE